MSMLTPMRKPSRMPFFTQALTRQPVGLAASGSAARNSPRSIAARKLLKSARCSDVYAAGLLSKSCSISVCMGHKKSAGFEDLFDFGLAGGSGRDQGQAPHGFEEAHHGHCGLDRAGAGLDEVDVHQRQES